MVLWVLSERATLRRGWRGRAVGWWGVEHGNIHCSFGGGRQPHVSSGCMGCSNSVTSAWDDDCLHGWPSSPLTLQSQID